MDSKNTLLETYKLGDLELKNKIVMASMTRCRCNPKDGIPNDLVVTYYHQRAGAGLIVTEATPISKQGNPSPGAGCLYTKEQAAGWKKVTDAIHSRGAKVFTQLWHGGRACSSKDTGETVVAPSALPIKEYDQEGKVVEKETPKALTTEEIKKIIGQFKTAATLAKDAGFDGVELHGANGYLPDQFLKSESNKRTDNYGGSVENRCRFTLEAIDALLSVWPANRVGIKLSPVGRYNYMYDENPLETYTYLLKQLSARKIAYVQVTQAGQSWGKSFFKAGQDQIADTAVALKKHFNGTFITNEGYTPETGAKVLQEGNADLVAFGKLFINNPDLVARIKNGWDLDTQWNWGTFFAGGEKGFTDFQKHSKNTVGDDEEDIVKRADCCNIF